MSRTRSPGYAALDLLCEAFRAASRPTSRAGCRSRFDPFDLWPHGGSTKPEELSPRSASTKKVYRSGLVAGAYSISMASLQVS